MSALVKARRTIRVNWDAAASDLRISPEHLKLEIGVLVGTGKGRLPRLTVQRQRLPLERFSPGVTVALEVNGSHLATVLDLHTELYIASVPDHGDLLSPSSEGAIVWDERTRVLLEGDGPRFPVMAVPFSEIFPRGTARRAPWHIHWTPSDWHRDFHGALQLFLNTERAEVVERMQQGDTLLMQAVLAEAVTQVCSALVLDPDAQDLADAAEDGSLLSQALYWLQLAFPRSTLAQMREIAVHRPGEFGASLLALSEIGVP
ncbi:MAG: hypothetical protein EA398_00865 [Deltaproteobacteria bacterium]|nr:MAG: hypothetical protein EA398_00865 [Deltaproteobacteria bacterium]